MSTTSETGTGSRGSWHTAGPVLLAGLALWIATVVVTWTTQN